MYWLNRFLTYLGILLRGDQTTDPRVLVIQPLPGIGDMVWHLPALQALAAKYGPLTIMTKARSCADQLLEGNSAVERVVWLERTPGRHDGLAGVIRLAADLRRLRLNEAWVMHGSARYTLALYLAGVERIISPGKGLQRLFSEPVMWLHNSQLKTHPISRAENMLKQADIPLVKHEGCLQASEEYLTQVRHEYPNADVVILGIGSSEPYKQWGSERFRELAGQLLQRNLQVVLIGGKAEQPLAEEICNLTKEPGLRLEIARPLSYITALLVISRAYIGNDTGVLNMALACGIPTLGLFGASAPLTHANNLHVIEPSNHKLGMTDITSAQVLDKLTQVLDIT